MSRESDSTDKPCTDNDYTVQTDGGATPSDPSELFAEQKQDLDEEWHEAFDALTQQGKSPSGIKATIEYVTTAETQAKVAKEHNVSEVTIRNHQAAVVALGPVDGIEGNHKSRMKTLDYCNHLADRLGWEKDREYSIKNNGGSNGTAQPNLLKPGWESIYEELVNDD